MKDDKVMRACLVGDDDDTAPDTRGRGGTSPDRYLIPSHDSMGAVPIFTHNRYDFVPVLFVLSGGCSTRSVPDALPSVRVWKQY